MTNPTTRRDVARAFAFVLIASSLLVCGCLGGQPGNALYDTEVEVKEQKVATFPIEVPRGNVLSIKVELTQGKVADFVFIYERDLSNYLDPQAQYSIIDKWSTLNASKLDTQIYVDQTDSYIFMVDNTQRPLNGAGPNGIIKAKVHIAL